MRKLREVVLAWRLEREFAGNQILQTYLNKVYFKATDCMETRRHRQGTLELRTGR